jgi:hypothetical protein
MATSAQKKQPVAAVTGSSVKTRKQLGTELVEVSFCGLHREVERLISAGADLEVTTRDGYSALSEAAIAGHTPVIGQLLRALADPNQTAPNGRTPLHRAVFQGWGNAVRLLLDNGADPGKLDEDQCKPADLTSKGDLKEMLGSFPLAQTRELIEERQKQLARLPKPPPEPEPAPAELPPHEVAAKPAPKAETNASKVAAQSFKPPPRKRLTKKEREQRYREALAELSGGLSLEDHEDQVQALRDAFPVSVARLEVMGAGEERLNGVYSASFLSKDRVEFEKDGDEQCQVFWCDYHSEWRMLIGDYKLGSALYRHGYKPNLKFDECHGVPEDGWTKWFGKDPLPLVLRLPPSVGEDDVEVAEKETISEQASAESGKEPACVDNTKDDEAHRTKVPADAEAARRREEFLELHPRLKIVAEDEGGAGRLAARLAKQHVVSAAPKMR